MENYLGGSTIKILVCGLPGSGKTTLAEKLAPMLGAVHFSADAVRDNINRDLGFSRADRVEQARRMGWLADQVVKAGHHAICDFICPTEESRSAFNADYTLWMDTVESCKFADTNAMWVSPRKYDLRVGQFLEPKSLNELCVSVRDLVSGTDGKATAQMLGRFQPWHGGHRALFEESMARIGRVCIMVRSMVRNEKNPLSFDEVKARIEADLADYAGKFTIIQVPNIVSIHYGREVGYTIEHIELPPDIQAISATDIRRRNSE